MEEEKKKKKDSESQRKKRQNESTYGKVGEKERKEGGDEIRTNVYGGKKNKNKQTNVWMK